MHNESICVSLKFIFIQWLFSYCCNIHYLPYLYGEAVHITLVFTLQLLHQHPFLVFLISCFLITKHSTLSLHPSLFPLLLLLLMVCLVLCFSLQHLLHLFLNSLFLQLQFIHTHSNSLHIWFINSSLISFLNCNPTPSVLLTPDNIAAPSLSFL